MLTKEIIKREVDLAIKKENPLWDGVSFDYGINTYKSVEKTLNTLLKEEHNEISLDVAVKIINRLMNGLPLSPIVFDDFENAEYTYKDTQIGSQTTKDIKQCSRMDTLFQHIITTTDSKDIVEINYEYVRVDGVLTLDVLTGVTWHDEYGDYYIRKKHPITLPYMPLLEPYLIRVARTDYGDYYIDYITPKKITYKMNILLSGDNTKEIKGFERLKRMHHIKKILKEKNII